MFHYGYESEPKMVQAIAKIIHTKGCVVEHMLECGKGTMSLNGFRVETFYSKEMGFYFLCD